MGTDTVCFARTDIPDLCADGIEFLAVTKYDGWTAGKDGVLGLAPVDQTHGPSYVERLYEQGQIQSPSATLWLNKKGTQSTLTLGGIPENSIQGSD